MTNLRLGLLTAVAVLLVSSVTVQAGAASRAFGTLVRAIDSSDRITIETPLGVSRITPSPNAKVERGRVGQRSFSATVNDLRPGDYLTVLTNSQGFACEISAIYDIVQGKVAKVGSTALTLSDGRKVKLHTGTQAILADGTADSPSKLKPGTGVTCRINPVNKQAWVVIATQGTNALSASKAASPNTDKPRISSLTYTPSADIQPGDKLTVELTGTPGGNASFDVMLLLPMADMTEISPGHYIAEVQVPSDGSVINAPLVGYLAVGDNKAAPVQAGKLITVKASGGDTTEPAAVATRLAVAPTQTAQGPVTISTPAVVPAKTPATVVPVPMTTPKQPERPRELADIILKTPEDGAKLKSAILVRGQATPNTSVAVTITYNNGHTGLLKLAGQVVSQVLSVGKNGEFRLGPITLDGYLATKGLRFTIKAYYPDRTDHGTAAVVAVGDRS